MPNLRPPIPGKENPATAVVAVVLVAGNFDPRGNPVDAVLAMGAAVVFGNPDNELNRGVAVLLAGATKPTESPVPAVLATVVVPADWIPPPRINLPATVVAWGAPRVNPELVADAAMLPPRVSPVGAVEAGIVPPPNVNPGVGVTVAGAVVLFTPNAKPCDGADAIRPPVSDFGVCAKPKSPAGCAVAPPKVKPVLIGPVAAEVLPNVNGEDPAAVVVPPSVSPPVAGAAEGAELPNANPDPPATTAVKVALQLHEIQVE